MSGFDAVLVVMGLETSDHRLIEQDALTWRELPIPLTNAMDTGDDHYGCVVGKIETITQEGNELRATGTFDVDSEAGAEAARLVEEQVKRWVSIDLEVITGEFSKTDPDCDEDDELCSYTMTVKEGRIMGAAMVAFPAFPQAVIVPAGSVIPESTDDGRPAVAASAFVVKPPLEWFEKPNLTVPTPIVVTDDGHIFGHVAIWGTCHTGYPNSCVTPPRSKTNYVIFRKGEIPCDCDTPVTVGQLTLVGGHASPALSFAQAMAHYDDTRSAVADIACGEDALGIWVSGALRPTVTDEQLRVIRASGVSGDWRRFGGNLELIAICSVNSPGFPVPRGMIAAGVQVSLVAAGALKPPEMDVDATIAAILERVTEAERVSVKHLLSSLRATSAV